MASFDPQAAASVAHQILVNRYLVLTTVTILAHEHVSTIPEDIDFMPSGRMTLMKALYVMNRYLPVITSAMAVYLVLGADDLSTCRPVFYVAAALVTMQYFISEAILFLRLSVIWLHNTIISAISIIAYTAFVLCTLIVGVPYFKSMQFDDSFRYSNGCILLFPRKNSWAVITAVIICETIALSLLSIRAWSQRTLSRQTLIKNLYHDGIVYYVTITVLSIATLINILAAPPVLAGALLFTQGVLHSILCNRLLLRIREINASLSDPSMSIHLSTLECSPVVDVKSEQSPSEAKCKSFPSYV